MKVNFAFADIAGGKVVELDDHGITAQELLVPSCEISP
jgi:hypothetical protein